MLENDDGTVVEDEHVYAVRIDDGAPLDGTEQMQHARAYLTGDGPRQAATVLGCNLEPLDRESTRPAARQDEHAHAPRRRACATAPGTAAPVIGR